MNSDKDHKNQQDYFGYPFENNSIKNRNKHKSQFLYISSQGSWEIKEPFVVKGDLQNVTGISEIINFELHNRFCNSLFGNPNIMKVTKTDNFNRESKSDIERQSYVNQISSSDKKSPQKKLVACRLQGGRQTEINLSDKVRSNKNVTTFKSRDCSPEFDPSQDIFACSPTEKLDCSQETSIENKGGYQQESPESCTEEVRVKHDLEKEIPSSMIRKPKYAGVKVIQNEKEKNRNNQSECKRNNYVGSTNVDARSSPPSKKRHKLEEIVSQNLSLLEDLCSSETEDEKRRQFKGESSKEGTFCSQNKVSSPIKFQITTISDCVGKVSSNFFLSPKQKIKLGSPVGLFNVEDSKNGKSSPLKGNFSQYVKGGIWTETPQKETNDVAGKGKTESQDQKQKQLNKKQKLVRGDIMSECDQINMNDSNKTLDHEESKGNTRKLFGEQSTHKETQEMFVDDTDIINIISDTEGDREEDCSIIESTDLTLTSKVQFHSSQAVNETSQIEPQKQVENITTNSYDQDQSQEQIEEDSCHINQSLTLGKGSMDCNVNEACRKETLSKQVSNLGCKSLSKKSINCYGTDEEVKKNDCPRKKRKLSDVNNGSSKIEEMQLSESKKLKANESHNESQLKSLTVIDCVASEKTVKINNADSITSMIIEAGEQSGNKETHVDANLINVISDSDITDIEKDDMNVLEDFTQLPPKPGQIANGTNVGKIDEVFSTNTSVEPEQTESEIHLECNFNTSIGNEIGCNETIPEDSRNETLKIQNLISDSSYAECSQENTARMEESISLKKKKQKLKLKKSRTSVKKVINACDTNIEPLTDSRRIEKYTKEELINFTGKGAGGQPACEEIEETFVRDTKLSNTQLDSEICGNDEKREDYTKNESENQPQFSDELSLTIWKKLLKLFKYFSPENSDSKLKKKTLLKNRNSESSFRSSGDGSGYSVLKNLSNVNPAPCNDLEPNPELQNSNSSDTTMLGELEFLYSSDEDCTVPQNNLSGEKVLPLGYCGEKSSCSNLVNCDPNKSARRSNSTSRDSNTSVQLKKGPKKNKLKRDKRNPKNQNRNDDGVTNGYSRENAKSFPVCSLSDEDPDDPEYKSSKSDCNSDSGNENLSRRRKTPIKNLRPSSKSNSPYKNKIPFVSSTPFTEKKNKFQDFYDENTSYGSDNLNESQNDDCHLSNSSFTDDTILEEIQCKIINSDAELKALERLTIMVDWVLSPLHEIDTGSCKVNMKMLKEKLGPEHSKYLNEGKFTLEDEKKVKQSWEEFMKEYEFTNPEVFFPSAQNFGHFPLKERHNFKLYLAKYLPERRLISVYQKFINMYGVKKKGRFSEKEDRLLLDIYHAVKRRNNLNFREGNETECEDKLGLPLKKVMSRALDRTVNSVDARLKILLDNEKHTSKKEIYWTPELEGALIHRLIKTLKVDSVEDLRYAKISYRVWRKVVSKVELPIDQVLNQWKYYLYPQLFARQPVLRHSLQIELIKWLYKSNIKDYKLIDWNDISKRAGDLGSCYLYRIFRTLIGNLVPKELRHNFRETIGFLYDHYIPRLKEKTSYMMIRKVYNPDTRTLTLREEDEVDCLSFRIE